MEMAPTFSKELPSFLSELLNDLQQLTAKFIEMIVQKCPMLREIVKGFQEVREMLGGLDSQTTRIILGISAVGLGLAGVPFSGGASLVMIGAGAFCAGEVFVQAAINKMRENGSMEKVGELGKSFMEIIEPLKNFLKKIIARSAKALRIKLEGCQETLKPVSQLIDICIKVLSEVETAMETMDKMDKTVMVVQNANQTPNEAKMIVEGIKESADQSKKLVDGFEKLRRAALHFLEAVSAFCC